MTIFEQPDRPYEHIIGRPRRRRGKYVVTPAFYVRLPYHEFEALKADACAKGLSVARLSRAIIKGYLRASYPQTFDGPLL